MTEKGIVKSFEMVYALKLENDKYYIGKTANVNQRIYQHFNGGGALWTKLHKPIDVLEVKIANIIDEQTMTLNYMCKYGWENVRGGGWTKPELKKPPIAFLAYKTAQSQNDMDFIDDSD